MSPRRRRRTDVPISAPELERIRSGQLSDRSSLRSRDVLRADGRVAQVTVQVSAECAGIVAGVDEALSLLRAAADDWSALAVHALFDGDRIDAWETVMTIEGDYAAFAPVATLCLGVLARRTRVATNARRFVEAARPKSIMVFAARHDHWLVQPGDAQAAYIGGASSVSSEIAPGGRNAPALATVPHGLIGAYGGDTLLATQKFAEHAAGAAQIIVPVDYENDAVRTALAVARALDERLWGVQLATSEHLVDQSIIPRMGVFPPAGVNAQLVWMVRDALDAEGFGDVKLLASGGFTTDRIREFEENGVPVDAYGIGAALFDGHYGFTADIIALDGAPHARAGREARPSDRLERVK